VVGSKLLITWQLGATQRTRLLGPMPSRILNTMTKLLSGHHAIRRSKANLLDIDRWKKKKKKELECAQALYHSNEQLRIAPADLGELRVEVHEFKDSGTDEWPESIPRRESFEVADSSAVLRSYLPLVDFTPMISLVRGQR
jgi:hypothetical protein